jgi:hypothetical protein
LSRLSRGSGGNGPVSGKVTQSRPEKGNSVVASVVLQELHDAAPKDHVTLRWMLERLPNQSFGLILMMLGIAATVPGISVFAGVLLVVATLQMIAGRPTPLFPRWIAERPLPDGHIATAARTAISVLRRFERAIHPRWPMPRAATKRVVGVAVLLLTVRLLLAPLPLSNILPAVVITLISLAYLEQDGLLLTVSLLAALSLLAIDLALVVEVAKVGLP